MTTDPGHILRQQRRHRGGGFRTRRSAAFREPPLPADNNNSATRDRPLPAGTNKSATRDPPLPTDNESANRGQPSTWSASPVGERERVQCSDPAIAGPPDG